MNDPFCDGDYFFNYSRKPATFSFAVNMEFVTNVSCE